MSPLTVPWPEQTPLPTASTSSTVSSRSPVSKSKGKRNALGGRSARIVEPRDIANQSSIDAAKEQCFVDSGNFVWSCWPTEETTIDQGQSSQFVWNSNQPSFRQLGFVDIALIRADTGRTVSLFTNVPNPTNRAGFQPLTVDDPWWGSDGPNWNGKNVPFPFYFLVDTAGHGFTTAQPQPTFTAVQTTFPASILAAMSSSSQSSASSASAASASSASQSASSGTGTGTSPRGTNTSSLQGSNGSGSPFPKWAIAVIVILGFFALITFFLLVFLIVTRMRRNRENGPLRRGSTGSQSPMMSNTQQAGSGYPGSPPANMAALGAVGAGGAFLGSEKGHAPSTVTHDAASTHSETPFSGADAAVMAEAFRKALRKPDFAGRPVEEGESPDQLAESEEQPELLNRELAEEGRDIRSVDSSRGVRVETLPDEGDPPTENDRML